jgi:dihydroflavonol-4-reductase
LKVLVTGATGFIGHKLVERLLGDRQNVATLVRNTSDTKSLPSEVELRVGDMLNQDSLEAAVKDAQTVIHLAAYFDFYPRDKKQMFRVNVNGTRALMNACVGTSVERFIYCSTTEAIGPVKHPPGNEETDLRPTFDYGRSKVMAENAVREISADAGLPHIIIRPTGVMGEGDFYTAYELIRNLNDRAVPVLPGDGQKHIMYIHVDDVVDGFIKALTSHPGLNNTIILCPNEPIKYRDLIEFIAGCLGVKPPTRYIPTSLAKLGIGLLSPFKNRHGTTFLWHRKTIQSMVEDRWYSNEKAKRLLGWSPHYTMVDCIKRTIDWYFANGHLEKKG